MSMELSNQVVQVQKVAITQKLIEYLEILQMPCHDLEQHISESIKDNPLLECDSSEDLFESLLESKKAEYSEKFSNTASEDFPDKDDFLAWTMTDETLTDYLKHQLLELKIPPLYKKIAGFLIENIDSDGYLREDINDLARILKVSVKLVKHCLRLLQSLEPAGICARDLKECLLLQLKRKKSIEKNVCYVIEHYFDMLTHKSFSKISRESGIGIAEIERIYNLIKSLNPKPGYVFNKNEWSPYIIPDLFLREIDGKYILMFNDESIPSVRINDKYVNLLKDYTSDPGLKDYIKKNLSRAVTLVKAIEQRKKTIMDTAGYIVAIQEDFLKKGSEYLKPLTMQIVAEKQGIHVSTVSRAVNGKYMQTPRGIFELRFFFSSTLEAGSEIKMSATSVKGMIRKLVQEEDKRKPLSDERIKAKLEEREVHVARRTVAKYREELSILPAAMRKT